MNAEQLLTHFDRLSEAPDAIPRLRRFILDLAVRGKLVEQDPSEESTSDLLARIADARIQLAKRGVLKGAQVCDSVPSNEVPFLIPRGWQIVRMGWIAQKLGAGSTPLGGKSVYLSEGIPFLRSQNVFDDGLRLDDVAFISRQTHDRMAGTHVQCEDILLNITGASIGRCALVPSTFGEGNVSQHVAIVRMVLPEIREFIHLSLTSPFFQKLIDDVQVGVSREGLSMQRLRQFPMLIPPLAEQHRIVAKVDELMALCDRLEAARGEREARRERLAAASLHRLNQPAEDPATFRQHVHFHLQHLPRLTTRPEQVLNLRKAILASAVRGLLSKPQEGDDLVDDLVFQVAEERGSVGRTESSSSTDRGLGEEVSMEVPDHWTWKRLGSLIVAGPTNGISPKPISHETNVRSLTLSATTTGKFRGEFTKYISNDVPLESDLWLRDGDVLVQRGNTVEYVGVPAVYHGAPQKFIFPDLMIRVRFASVLNVDFIHLVMSAEPLRNFLRTRASGTAGSMPKINHTILKQLPIPVPPLAEQRRIVAKVEELMSVCDHLEAGLTHTQTESRRLLEAVLHEALAPALFTEGRSA